MPNEIEYSFYLGLLQYQDMETANQMDNKDITQNHENSLIPAINNDNSKVFVSQIHLIEFDTFVSTHGPSTDVDCK